VGLFLVERRIIAALSGSDSVDGKWGLKQIATIGGRETLRNREDVTEAMGGKAGIT
jgi:hypothetical protein